MYSQIRPLTVTPFCCVFLHIMTGIHARGGFAASLLFVTSCRMMATDSASAPSPSDPLQHPNNTVHIAPADISPPLLPDATTASAEGGATTASARLNTAANGTHPSLYHWNLKSNPKYVLPVPSKGTSPPNTMAKREGSKEASPAPKPSIGVHGIQSTAAAKIESVPGFVSTHGQNFMLNGRAAYFAGTNAW